MRVGLIGLGAIANMHARAYANIGYTIPVCTTHDREAGRRFAAQHGSVFVETYEEVCRHPDVDFVDVCTFPDFRLLPLEACAAHGKHIQVQKPMAIDLATARRMIEAAAAANIQLGVVSQHRFDAASEFMQRALREGRLGTLLQVDAYVKWHRSDAYYARPVKGSWATEGGGALINQAIHQVDLLRWLAGPVAEVFAIWKIGAAHAIESEDMVTALLRYESGVSGVIQASTAFWPGYPERIEFHGTRGTAVITGDRLTTWDVRDDGNHPDRAPLQDQPASGASDPMAISVETFEKQFLDFGEAIRTGRKPRVGGEEGYQALEVVDAIYRSCRTGDKVAL